MGGSLDPEETPGGGLTMILSLPAAASGSPDGEADPGRREREADPGRREREGRPRAARARGRPRGARARGDDGGRGSPQDRVMARVLVVQRRTADLRRGG